LTEETGVARNRQAGWKETGTAGATLPHQHQCMHRQSFATEGVRPGFLTVVYVKNSDLWVAIGFNAPRQITFGPRALHPMLSPDGTKVLFQRNCSCSTCFECNELWVINTDGTNERRLVSAADLSGQMGDAMEAEEETMQHRAPWLEMQHRTPWEVAWLEDSRRIAFNTVLPGDHSHIFIFYDLWIADTETGAVTRLLEDGDGGTFAFSPDCSKILVSNHNSVSLVNADGSERRQLVSNSFVNYYNYFTNPVWAPDGSYGLGVIASEELYYDDDGYYSKGYIKLWRLPLTGEATVISTLPGMNLPYYMHDDRGLFWNAARTALAYYDSESTLHLATLAGESLQSYEGGPSFYGWSSDDSYWIFGHSREFFLAGTDMEPTPLELPEVSHAIKWVSGTVYMVDTHYRPNTGSYLSIGQVGGSLREFATGVNIYLLDTHWVE
jgi:hypothetical protein